MIAMFLNPGQSQTDNTSPCLLFSRHHKADTSGQKTAISSQSRTSYLMLAQIGDPCYRLRYPILLTQEIGEQGETIVFDDGFDVYGVGETTQEAVGEYASMLVDLFQELVASEDALSCHLRQQLRTLRMYLTTR